mgnify:CR=1 FL=1
MPACFVTSWPERSLSSRNATTCTSLGRKSEEPVLPQVTAARLNDKRAKRLFTLLNKA